MPGAGPCAWGMKGCRRWSPLASLLLPPWVLAPAAAWSFPGSCWHCPGCTGQAPLLICRGKAIGTSEPRDSQAWSCTVRIPLPCTTSHFVSRQPPPTRRVAARLPAGSAAPQALHRTQDLGSLRGAGSSGSKGQAGPPPALASLCWGVLGEAGGKRQSLQAKEMPAVPGLALAVQCDWCQARAGGHRGDRDG